MKYFVLGAIASGALLYGISIIYGVTGSLLLDEHRGGAVGRDDLPAIGLLFGLAFIVVGVAVQVRRRAVPHVVAGRLSRGADAGDAVRRLGAEDRLVRTRHARARRGTRAMRRGAWQDMLIVLAALSMIVGNVVAIAQTNIKRMLAYSTILARRFHPARRAGRQCRRATAARCSTR